MVVGRKTVLADDRTPPPRDQQQRPSQGGRLRRSGCGVIVAAPRESRCRGREFGPWAGVVGGLTGVGAAPEAERVVEERLQESVLGRGSGCRRCSTEPLATVSPRVTWYFASPGSALAMLSRLRLQHRDHRVELVECRCELLLRCRATSPDTSLATAEVWASSSMIA